MAFYGREPGSKTVISKRIIQVSAFNYVGCSHHMKR